MSESNDLYLIDGYALIFRAYFAFIRNPLTNPSGFNVSAIHGFTRMLLSIIKEFSPGRLVVCLDSRTPTFRDEMYSEYKMTRDKTPEDLKAQFPVIETLLERFSIPTIRHNGVEADDIIATLARQASAAGEKCYIVSGDKDLYQLVDDYVFILKPSRKGGFDVLGREEVIEEKGVRADQIVDYLSLLGDTADNVPGVKGIGQKSAEALLQKFDHLDDLYANLDQLTEKKELGWKKKLEESREQAFLSRDLVILKDDVEIDFEDGDLSLDYLDGAAAAAYLAEYQLPTLSAAIKKVSGATPSARKPYFGMDYEGSREVDPAGGHILEDEIEGIPKSGASSGAAAGVSSGTTAASGGADSEKTAALSREITSLLDGYQSLEAKYELVRTADELQSWVDACRKAGTVAFDTETDSINPLVANLAGFSLSHTAGHACYVPVSSPELRRGDMPNGSHLTEEEALEILAPLLTDGDIRVIGQNIKYDYKILALRNVRIANVWFDTMIAAWLLDTTQNAYGMDALASRYLSHDTEKLIPMYEEVTGEKITKNKEATIDFARVPLDRAVHYAAEDADITLRLYRLFDLMLRHSDSSAAGRALFGQDAPLPEQGLQTKLLRELEMPLIPILAEMEIRGIGLDVETLRHYSTELATRLEEIEGEIYELAGHEFNIASTKQLQTVLFEERKLTPVKKTKTGYSTDTSVLEQLASEDKIPELVLRHRTLAKLKSTYVDTLPELVNSRTGRIHTSFQLNGTATGRISSHDPNLQNIPIRDEEGRRIRSAFIPTDGKVFVSADYSQIELVVLAHLSGDDGLSRAFLQGVDVHRRTGSLIFQVDEEDVTPLQRRIAKSINFGVMYGMSAFRLSNEIGVSRKEAQEFIDSYFQTYSKIRAFIDGTVKLVEKRGYVETIEGRRRPVPSITSRNRNEKMSGERIAVNTPIQGSAADIVKRAMLRIDSALREKKLGSRMLLQVHDELIFECPVDEAETLMQLLKDEMPQAIRLSVPLGVSVEQGASWGEMH